MNDLGATRYPIVPGHELIGTVAEVGKGAAGRGFAVGDVVGVGCIVDSCLTCRYCLGDEEQYCANEMTMTYGSETKHGRAGPNGRVTVGGYSTSFVVNSRFAIKIPAGVDDLAACAPLMCAGITLFDPIKAFGVREGVRVGVAGVGGLGIMGIKIAAALGAEVTAISRTNGKEAKAKAAGAKHFVASSDAEAMKNAAGSLDLILDTISACHDSEPYAAMLDKKGTLCMIGLQTTPVAVNATQFVFNRIAVTGSLIGGIKNTQEMIDFCVEKKLYPEIKIIDAKEIPAALKSLSEGNDEGVRYVIDCKTIK
jgi:uncharacterized zinc-type alcohol dehydrogenase-like protein